jgi:peroxiredoxin
MLALVLIAQLAAPWKGLTWIQGGPVEKEGHVVLVRFWTDGCSLCRDSAPALEKLWRSYKKRGLVVVGIHHPKREASRDLEVVRAATRELGFTFPVATDPEWTTVRSYGIGTTYQKFTSMSFLIDRKGTIRWVHEGGVLEGEALGECRKAIESALSGSAPAGSF